MVYNEFKSVIAQRVVVERILPIMKVGERSVEQAEEMSQEEREAGGTRRRVRRHQPQRGGHC